MRAFLDTGSTLTIMSTSLANRLIVRIDPKASIKVNHIGSQIKRADRTFVDLCIGLMTHRIEIHVFDDFFHDLLVGTKDAAKYNVKADLTTLSLVQSMYGREENVNFVHASLGEERTSSAIDHAIFARDKGDIGCISIDRHHIRLREGTAPISLRPYWQ